MRSRGWHDDVRDWGRYRNGHSPVVDMGANPLLAVEPDPRLATYLRETIPDEALRVIVSSFEEAVLDAASFGLGIAATAFHWLSEATALTKIAELLRPGGWWAMVWNVFGDDRPPRSLSRSDQGAAQWAFESLGRRPQLAGDRCRQGYPLGRSSGRSWCSPIANERLFASLSFPRCC